MDLCKTDVTPNPGPNVVFAVISSLTVWNRPGPEVDQTQISEKKK